MKKQTIPTDAGVKLNNAWRTPRAGELVGFDIKVAKPANHWKIAAIILFLLLAFVTIVLSHKIHQQQDVIDFQQELFEKLEQMELPKGDGTIHENGVLPPKEAINPSFII